MKLEKQFSLWLPGSYTPLFPPPQIISICFRFFTGLHLTPSHNTLQNKSVSGKYGHSNFPPITRVTKWTAGKTPPKRMCPYLSCAVQGLHFLYFPWALAYGTICLNKLYISSDITPVNVPVAYSHLLVFGFRSPQQMVPPPRGHLGNLCGVFWIQRERELPQQLRNNTGIWWAGRLTELCRTQDYPSGQETKCQAPEPRTFLRFT